MMAPVIDAVPEASKAVGSAKRATWPGNSIQVSRKPGTAHSHPQAPRMGLVKESQSHTLHTGRNLETSLLETSGKIKTWWCRQV